MEDVLWDAVVAGAGPVGSVAARELAAQGFRVLILEEHREVGRPVQCAGLVTRRVFEAVDAEEAVINSLDTAQLIAPTGRAVEFGGGGERAVVVDRARFDSLAAEGALSAGCRLELGTRVKGVAVPEGAACAAVAVEGPRGSRTVRARAVVGADGVQSVVGRSMGLRPPPEMLPGFEAELSGVEGPRGTVRVVVGRDVAPGFFGWLIPSGERKALLGLCVRPGGASAREHFQMLRKDFRLERFIGRAQVIRYFSGVVPVSCAPRTSAERLLLVGDSAGQVKPVTGGGLYTGTRCALLAAGVMGEALEEDDLSARKLRLYERKWKEALGRELRFGRRLRKAFVNVTDDQMDELVRMLSRPELLGLVSARGDLDAPSELAKLLFRKAPGLLKFAGPFIKSLLE